MSTCSKALSFLHLSSSQYFWFVVVSLILFHPILIAQTLDENLPVANGIVAEIIQDGNTLYIGGEFTYVGPNTGSGVVLDPTTANYNPNFPKINGPVYASISDGDGGWYIGGVFTRVGNSVRSNLAHILSDGTVGSWNPGTDGKVIGLYKYGSTIYIGGFFSSVGGVSRNFIASVDASTGITTNWYPRINGPVKAFAATDLLVYVGGKFDRVSTPTGNIVRNNLACFNRITAELTSWNISVDAGNANVYNVVEGMQLANNNANLYIWGNIGSVAATNRRGAALLNTTSNTITTWNPNATNAGGYAAVVTSLVVVADTVYLAGNFTRMKSTSNIRHRAAAVTRTGTGTLLPWNPNITGNWQYREFNFPQPMVRGMEIVDNVVYLVGDFNFIGGKSINNVAAVSRTTGSLLEEWNPNAPDRHLSDIANTISWSKDKPFVGGEFNTMNAKKRYGIAAIDLVTKTVLPFNPDLFLQHTGQSEEYPEITRLAQFESTLFIAGRFSRVGTQPKSNFAAIDKVSGLAINFFDDDTINTEYVKPYIAVNDNKLYISSNFTSIGDSTRNGIASIDLITKKVTGWNPNIGEHYGIPMYSMAFSASAVYIHGQFSEVGGQPRNKLAAVDNITGAVLPWNPMNDPSFNISVSGMQFYDNILYMGVNMYQGGNQIRNGVAAIDAITGEFTPWNPIISSGVPQLSIFDLKVSESAVYVAGDFKTIGGIERRGIASINRNTGEPTQWNPEVKPYAAGIGNSATCYSIHLNYNNNTVYFGGEFRTVKNLPVRGIAGYSDSTLILPTKTVQLTALIEGFYDGSSMVSDTVTVELRNSTAPYALVESKSIVLNNLGQGTGTFSNAQANSSYYLVVKHRNSIETWSKTPQTFTSGIMNYDFTTAANKAYGDNLKLKLGKYCIYNGDINQDGRVDLFDLIEVDNDNANFVTGYVPSDVNGDNSSDLADMIIVDNNNAAFVGKVTPLGMQLKTVNSK